MTDVTMCSHETTEPVETAGDLVALICTDCLDRLPVNWDCDDCDWDETRTFGGQVDVFALPCRRHRHLP